MSDITSPGWIGGISGLYDRIFRAYPTAVLLRELSIYNEGLFVRVSNRSDRPIIVRHVRHGLSRDFHLRRNDETGSIIDATLEKVLEVVIDPDEHEDLRLWLPPNLNDRAADEVCDIRIQWEYAQPKWVKLPRKLAVRLPVGNLRKMVPPQSGTMIGG